MDEEEEEEVVVMVAKIDRDQTERALIERKICLERENWNLNREIFKLLYLFIYYCKYLNLDWFCSYRHIAPDKEWV